MLVQIRFCYYPYGLCRPAVAYTRSHVFTAAMKEVGGGIALVRKMASDQFPSLADDATYSWIDKHGSSVALRTDADLSAAFLLTAPKELTVHIHRPFRTITAVLMPLLFIFGLITMHYAAPRIAYGLLSVYWIIFGVFAFASGKEENKTTNTKPTYVYQAQLDSMMSIGFDLNVACIALGKANGDLNSAIEIAARIAYKIVE